LAKVIDNFKVGKHLIIVLDSIKKDFTKIEIEGTLYDATIAYDIPNAISIESNNDFIGKTVKFYG
jgi:predicted nucleotidyltransferase